MVQAEKALRILGFAHRARKLSLGTSATLAGIMSRKVQSVVLALDLSENTRSKIEKAARLQRIPIYCFGKKGEFGHFFKCKDVGVIGVLDKSFSQGVGQSQNAQ